MADPHHILIIDDDPDFRLAVSTRLNAEGFEVFMAGSGSEGLDAMDTQDFDLILIDMVMPEKDGVATYQELRGNPRMREVPVILLTGVAVEGHWEPMQYEEDSRAFVMGKPYEHSMLVARINQLLTEDGDGL